MKNTENQLREIWNKEHLTWEQRKNNKVVGRFKPKYISNYNVNLNIPIKRQIIKLDKNTKFNSMTLVRDTPKI